MSDIPEALRGIKRESSFSPRGPATTSGAYDPTFVMHTHEQLAHLPDTFFIQHLAERLDSPKKLWDGLRELIAKNKEQLKNGSYLRSTQADPRDKETESDDFITQVAQFS